MRHQSEAFLSAITSETWGGGGGGGVCVYVHACVHVCVLAKVCKFGDINRKLERYSFVPADYGLVSMDVASRGTTVVT